MPTCLLKNFHGWVLSMWVFLGDGHYLNNRVFLSRNYWLIVAPWKLDVIKTNVCLRCEALRANRLVRTSNFQGATITPIVPRHKNSCCLYCSPLNFLPCASSKIILNYFQLFRWKSGQPNVKFETRKQSETLIPHPSIFRRQTLWTDSEHYRNTWSF